MDWRKVPHRKFAFRSQSARAATLIQLARKKRDRLQPGSQSITRCERLRSCSRGGARYRRYHISYAPATQCRKKRRRSLCASGLQERVYKRFSIRSRLSCTTGGLEVLQAAEDLSAAANHGWSPKRWSRRKTFDSATNNGEV